MKFRQKIYVSVLLLFFFCYVGSAVYMVSVSYKTVMENERETAISNTYLVENSMMADFAVYYKYDILGSDNMRRIFLDYSLLYKRKNIFLQLMEGGEVTHSSYLNKELKIDWNQAEEYKRPEVEGLITEFSDKGKNYLAVRNEMDTPFEDLSLVYIYPLEQLEENRSSQLFFFMITGIPLMLFLMILLYFILKRLTKPLGELTEAAYAMAQGEYSKRVSVKGRDEIAELAENFNDMTGKVEETIGALKEADLQKQQFIDNLGHELRTPLTTVSGYAEYLLRAAVTEQEKVDALQYIIGESKRLQKLSGTLLKLATLREDEVEKHWIAIDDIMDSACTAMRESLDKNGIELEKIVETKEVYGNEELLTSLVINLLENAVRACEGGGKIKISWDQEEEGNPRLIVCDNGIGMREEELQKIEEPFYRVDKARSRKSGGIGLGMSLCREIVRCHGGQISYDSIYGEYTKIIITFTS